jgi:hypothetical protein
MSTVQKKENLFIIMLNNDYVDIYLFSLRSWCLGLRSFFYRFSKMKRQFLCGLHRKTNNNSSLSLQYLYQPFFSNTK